MDNNNSALFEWCIKAQRILNQIAIVTHKYNLSLGTFRILNMLYSKHTITAYDITKIENTSRPAVSRKLNLLQAKRYIEKHHDDPNDQRVVRVTLTPLGKKAYLEMLEKFKEYTVVNNADIVRLNQILMLINKNNG